MTSSFNFYVSLPHLTFVSLSKFGLCRKIKNCQHRPTLSSSFDESDMFQFRRVPSYSETANFGTCIRRESEKLATRKETLPRRNCLFFFLFFSKIELFLYECCSSKVTFVKEKGPIKIGSLCFDHPSTAIQKPPRFCFVKDSYLALYITIIRETGS